MGGKKEEIKQNTSKLLCILKGMAVAYALTCIIFIAFGILLTYTNMQESTIPMVALATTALSAAVAGFDWAKCMQKRGLVWSAAAGLVYAVLLYLITSFGSGDFSFEISCMRMLVVSVVAGIAGGILGVNRKEKKNNLFARNV